MGSVSLESDQLKTGRTDSVHLNASRPLCGGTQLKSRPDAYAALLASPRYRLRASHPECGCRAEVARCLDNRPDPRR